MKRRLVLAATVGLAGCASLVGLNSFDIVNETAEGGAADGAPVTDATADTSITDGGTIVLPPVTCAAPAGTCAALGLDAVWQPVGLSPGGVTCPAGFGDAVSLLGPIEPSGGTPCACAVSGTTLPTCTGSTIQGSTSDGNEADACTKVNNNAVQTDGCNSDTNAFEDEFVQFNPPTGTDASCTAGIVSDKTKVIAVPITLCPALAPCAESICAGTRLGVLTACVVADGDLACPPGPFTQKLPVGTAIEDVVCSACSCGIASQDCGGVLDVYDTPSCNPGTITVLEAHVCTAVKDVNIKGYEYVPFRTVQTVIDGGALVGATFANPRTVCCVP